MASNYTNIPQEFDADLALYQAYNLAGKITDAFLILSDQRAPIWVKMPHHKFINEMFTSGILLMWSKMVVASPGAWWSKVGIRPLTPAHAEIVHKCAKHFVDFADECVMFDEFQESILESATEEEDYE